MQGWLQLAVSAGGADTEDDEVYRARIQFEKRNPPQCGSVTDYIRWAKEVPGVTRAFVFPLELGDGTVVVRFMTDGIGNGIPTPAFVAAVDANIRAQMPANVKLTVEAPIAELVDVDVRTNPFSTSVTQAVNDELGDLFIRDSVAGGSILISRLREAVSSATGEIDNVVDDPTADVAATSTAHILILGTVTVNSL